MDPPWPDPTKLRTFSGSHKSEKHSLDWVEGLPAYQPMQLHFAASLKLRLGPCGRLSKLAVLSPQPQCWFFFSACAPGNASHIEPPAFASFNVEINRTRYVLIGGETDKSYKSYENTTLWMLSTINCILVALVFAKGKPFRQPVYKNCKSKWRSKGWLVPSQRPREPQTLIKILAVLLTQWRPAPRLRAPPPGHFLVERHSQYFARSGVLWSGDPSLPSFLCHFPLSPPIRASLSLSPSALLSNEPGSSLLTQMFLSFQMCLSSPWPRSWPSVSSSSLPTWTLSLSG